MNITLYNCTSENNRLDKTEYLTQLASYTGAVARDTLDIMNPTLVLEENVANINSANYCFIEDFGRFYYIVDKSADVNGLFILKLSVDVLMSFKTEIRWQSGIVDTQEHIYNMYLPGNIPHDSRPLITTVKADGIYPYDKFDTSTSTFVLLAVGGK